MNKFYLTKIKTSGILMMLAILPVYSQDKYKQGVILLKDGNAIISEYTNDNDTYFLRNEKKGKSFPSNEIDAVVSGEYYTKIKKSYAWKSSIDSLIYFNASASYQWQDHETSEFEDLSFRIVKISLLLLTGFFYYESNLANQQLQRSYTGINSNAARTRFERSYSNYQTFGLLSLLTYSFATYRAYIRFGTNENMESLDIPNRNLMNLEEFFNREGSSQYNYKNNLMLTFERSF
ncbi:MAG: hypothetical protein O9346_13705 [Leptospiraceae bacterium]|jgi:hypothetical protein|nr:hypothetical protein [Leptospiraceae bacterium]MCZ8347465.1 hypothetical protein [Leptospiraceae bacterium]